NSASMSFASNAAPKNGTSVSAVKLAASPTRIAGTAASARARWLRQIFLASIADNRSAAGPDLGELSTVSTIVNTRPLVLFLRNQCALTSQADDRIRYRLSPSPVAVRLEMRPIGGRQFARPGEGGGIEKTAGRNGFR